jgi:hypothetical protein
LYDPPVEGSILEFNNAIDNSYNTYLHNLTANNTAEKKKYSKKRPTNTKGATVFGEGLMSQASGRYMSP